MVDGRKIDRIKALNSNPLDFLFGFCIIRVKTKLGKEG